MKTIDLENLLVPYKEQFLMNLSEFVSINSTYDESSKDDENPFGKGVSNALDFIYRLAKKDGFEVKNYNNMLVEILLGDEEKNITILAHADVVPSGEGWESNPFRLKKEGDIIYGRGVSDDKGPLLACYYALKALKEKKLINGYQVRFLVGGNEESGSLGMKYYFETLKKKEPTFGFSPDSDFPLIYAEKGGINFTLTGQIDLKDVISIKGGQAFNSVIEKTVLNIKHNQKLIDYIKENKINAEIKENENGIDEIIFFGVAAHGATPENGVNAGMICLKALQAVYLNKELKKIIDAYSPLDGSGLNVDAYSFDMGHNSLNFGLLNYKDNNIYMALNYRYVNGVNPQEMLDKIISKSKPFTITVVDTMNLLFYPKDSTLIKTLLEAYQIETQDYVSKPLAIGGGTYAKETKNVVAFGAQFEGFDTYMHSNKERARISDLYKAMKIYARAILMLGNKINED